MLPRFVKSWRPQIMKLNKIDEIREERKGPNKIGTTGRGIGPAYVDNDTEQS